MGMDVKLLVVDDNASDILLFEESIEVIEQSLKEKDIYINFNINTASNGVNAIDLIDKQKYNIIFLDLKMPKMNGIELLKYIRLKDQDTYIVMYTTSDYDEDVIDAHAGGSNGYLLKSLDIIELEENLKGILLLFLQDNFIYFNVIKPKYKKILC